MWAKDNPAELQEMRTLPESITIKISVLSEQVLLQPVDFTYLNSFHVRDLAHGQLDVPNQQTIQIAIVRA